MKKLMDFIINILYPKRCSFCNVVIYNSSRYFLCNECLAKVKFIEDGCIKCGKVLAMGYDELCNDCRTIRHYFDKAYSAVEYRDEVKKALIRYKFFGKKQLIDTFVELMLYKVEKLKNIDLVVGVPLHQKRFKERGFNQSENLAKLLAERLGYLFDNKILAKVKETQNQSELSRIRRLKNLKLAFKIIDKTKVKGKDILLVDDIYTTGATVSECSKVLKQAGASHVYVLTIASGKGY